MVHGVGLLLLSAVGGYWVLERAATHKGNLKKVGQILGTVIILTSLLGLVCRVWYFAQGPAGFCPFTKTGKGGYGSSMPRLLPETTP